jgi:hypothetical protein
MTTRAALLWTILATGTTPRAAIRQPLLWRADGFSRGLIGNRSLEKLAPPFL